MAKVNFLLGGPYKKGTETHKYGHCAMRIRVGAIDATFDFGRYGNTTGLFKESGDGILRIWSSFANYIKIENSYKRVTIEYIYDIVDTDAQAMYDLFMAEVAKGKLISKDDGLGMQSFNLSFKYFALGPNCTTICINSSNYGNPGVMNGSMAFYKPTDVLDFKEIMALGLQPTPKKLFLPANLERFMAHRKAQSTGLFPNERIVHGA